MSTRRPSYTAEEVRQLIEHYQELKAQVDTTPRGLRVLVKLADLDLALERVSIERWEVILLHGLLGLTQERTADLLQVSHQAVSKRYRYGLEEATLLINGGTY